MTYSPQLASTGRDGAPFGRRTTLAVSVFVLSLLLSSATSSGSNVFAQTPQSSEPVVVLTPEEARRLLETLAAAEQLAREHEALRAEADALRDAAMAALVAAQKYEAAAESWKVAYEGERALRLAAEEDARAARRDGKKRALKWGAIALGIGAVIGSAFGN